MEAPDGQRQMITLGLLGLGGNRPVTNRCRDGQRCSGLARMLLLLIVLAMTGCASMGPGTVTKDRFDYTAAVGDSWKTQMLLNLVKIRYGDAPVFLDIGQIVAARSLLSNVSATGTLFQFFSGPVPNAVTGSAALTAGTAYADTPTVTYAPLAGERFARQLMAPLPPAAILNVIQAGFPVDAVFRFGVQSVNGIDNRRVLLQQVKPADPQFYALLKELRLIQGSGDIGARSQRVDKEDTLSLVLRPKPSAVVERAFLNVVSLLGLDPATREFRVVYGAVATGDKEIAIQSRSILEILTDLSAYIAVPEAHVAERRVGPTPEADQGPEGPIPPLIRIASSASHPDDAFVTVPYRGYWYSIDDRDMGSKSLFSFIMFIFTFVETGSKEAPPVLTIPTR